MVFGTLKARLGLVSDYCSLKTVFLLNIITIITVVMVTEFGYSREMIQHLAYLPYYFRGRWTNGGMFMENINSSSSTQLKQDVTIVTAYFNLGTFRKGHAQIYNPELYRKWMKILSILQNPLVVFVDSEKDYEYIKKLRATFPLNATIVKKISRTNLWAFNLLPRINKIYSSFGYPKFYPNTVLPEYSCAMHAKYELTQTAAFENPYKTKYIAWLDIGCFRDLNVDQEQSLSLYVPPALSKNKVAYTEVFKRDPSKTSREIFRGNHVWVSGSFFIGYVDAVLAWTREYVSFVEKFLDEGLMDTDQQVIYSMANLGTLSKSIQTYHGDGRYNYYFHLAYISRENGFLRDRKN